MEFSRNTVFALVVMCMAGHASADVVKVHITPASYQTGEVRSALAAPVVDEVVSRKPSNVLMVICKRTPPAKVIQFEVELSARHKTSLKSTWTEDACPV